MSTKNYYEVMGLDKKASQADIKRAYRKLARKYHPDLNKEKNAEAKFKELGEAYDVLKNKEKRQAYDQHGEQWQNPYQNVSQGQNENYQHFNQEQNVNFEDILSSVFGHGQPHTRHQNYGKGQDIHSKLTISLEESIEGAEKVLQLQGSMSNAPLKTIKVKIPKGIGDKQQIRLKGQGGIGQNSQPGDLFIEVSITPHKLYKLRDKDLYLELPITPWEAALGAMVSVPTPYGSVNLTIPAASNSGTKLRLKGKGLPATEPGALFITLKIIIPPVDNDESKKLYEQLAKITKYNPRQNLGSS